LAVGESKLFLQPTGSSLKFPLIPKRQKEGFEQKWQKISLNQT
jgi:hypothetical protein